jgi:dipeptidyl aminopeptidase/acylaminoacyl peptidase
MKELLNVLVLVTASVVPGLAETVTYPQIPETKIPITELKPGETAYAAVRKPPGEGPFPAVIFLHGGLGQSPMVKLRRGAVEQPAQARFLAWGYVTVNATRRAIQHDPGDRGVVDDTLLLVDAVRNLPYIDTQSIALYGGSGGGTLALEVASVTGNLAAIVAGEPATVIYMGMFNKSHIDFDANGRPTGDRRWDVMKADPRKLYTAELRGHTRGKLRELSTPTLILHGDQHELKNFNLGIFIPEMKALGKPVKLMTYPGEYHGFYWGQGRIPPLAQKANRDADAFLRKHIKTQPKPVDRSWVRPVTVVPRARPDNN